MDPSLFHSVWTVALVIAFVGIVIWAYNGKRKARFDEAAQLPLEDDPRAPSTSNVAERPKHV